VTFQFVFELAVVRNLARLLPHLTGVVIRNVPELAGRPPVYVEHLSHLAVVEDSRSMRTVYFQHSERLYKLLYSLLL